MVDLQMMIKLLCQDDFQKNVCGINHQNSVILFVKVCSCNRKRNQVVDSIC